MTDGDGLYFGVAVVSGTLVAAKRDSWTLYDLSDVSAPRRVGERAPKPNDCPTGRIHQSLATVGSRLAASVMCGRFETRWFDGAEFVRPQASAPEAVAVTPGQLVASNAERVMIASETEARVLDAATLDVRLVIPFAKMVTTAAIGNDATAIASQDEVVFVDSATGRERRRVAAVLPTTGVAAVGNTLLATTTGDGLRCIDIADPARSRVVGALLPGTAIRQALPLGERMIALALPGKAVVIGEIANDCTFHELSRIAVRPAFDVSLLHRGTMLYVTGNRQLTAIDISAPERPIVVQSLEQPSGYPWRPVTIEAADGNSWLAFASNDPGYVVAPIGSDGRLGPASMVPIEGVGQLILSWSEGSRLYVTNESRKQVLAYDLAQPLAPRKIGQFESTDQNARIVGSTADGVLIADGLNGVYQIPRDLEASGLVKVAEAGGVNEIAAVAGVYYLGGYHEGVVAMRAPAAATR